jgi:putative tricarboxylic transport membrane protein
MLDGVLEGLLLVFAWPAIGYLLLGVFIGMWMGAVPGLGGVIGLVILLPFTFGMETVSAFALLLGMFAVTSTADTISSVLLGIPGTVASQATILDGHPLAMKGQADRAFGAAYTVSAFGGVFGALIMAASLPIILPVILAFGVTEFFMLAVLGLAMVGSLTGSSVAKGLTVAGLGLFLTSIGEAETTGVARFTFDQDYLAERLPIVPVVLGLFGIPELLDMAVKNTSIARVPMPDQEKGGMRRGIRDAMENWWLALRCAAIGTYIGMLPGLGAAIVDWIAYGHAVQSAKDKSQFGHGDIRGVIAPEAANNAIRGGSLIPTVAFGIPGSLGTAILLGALIIQGLKPGPEMLGPKLAITFSMVWDIVIANIVAAGLLMIWSRQISKIAYTPGHLVVPGVMVLILMGAWIASGDIGDWWLCLGMGGLGYLMRQGGWPRPPLVLAIVLGALMEQNLQLSVQIHQGFRFLWQAPIVIAIEVLVAITLLLSIRSYLRKDSTSAQPSEAAEGGIRNPLFSLPVSLLMAAVFIWGWIETEKFEEVATAQFPSAILHVALPLALIAVAMDVRAVRRVVRSAGLAEAANAAARKADLGPAVRFFAFLAALLAITYVAGQYVALALFVAGYLVFWGRYRWRIVAIYTAASIGFVYVFYDRVLHLFFHPSWLFG